jgi:Ni,Fe-hydrogenase III large subunit
MAELERLANHVADFGFVCNDAAYALIHAHCGILREEILQAADACFGHRLMMDRIVPGGVAADLDAAGAERLRGLVAKLRPRLAELEAHYDGLPSLQDRTVSTGTVRPELVQRFAAGGYVGRAAGRAFDARKILPYPPYDRLAFEVPVLAQSDVNARVWVRLREITQSLSLLEQILDGMPEGPILTPIEPGAGEGLGIVEGFRGEVLVWLKLGADGRIARCHPRDPSWFQWPLLEAAIEGNIVADFPLCNKSFNCSYAGHDL